MPFHIVASQESIDPALAFVPITGVADQTITVTGDILYVPEQAANLIGAVALLEGTTEGMAYLESPSLRANALYDIYPTYDVIEPVDSQNVVIHPEDPIPLSPGEGVIAYINSNPAAAAVQTVGVILSDGPITPVHGQMLHVRFVVGITETLGVWTNGQITLRQTLPVGRYQVVGAVLEATSGALFRMNFIGQYHRPGFVTHDTEAEYCHPKQRNGGLGIWGEFHTNVLPSIDLLASITAGTDQSGILDLIRVG